MIEFEKYRREDGSIDLFECAIGNFPIKAYYKDDLKHFLEMVEQICPVKSRQVAAIAIATAIRLAEPTVMNTEKIET